MIFEKYFSIFEKEQLELKFEPRTWLAVSSQNFSPTIIANSAAI
jgi:hypothetical protein